MSVGNKILRIFVFQNRNSMATIILDYNTRNVQAQKALDYILSLGFFKAHAVKNSHKKDSSINPVKTHAIQDIQDPFAEVRGIWADRDVDARTLRNEAWKINTD